MIHELSEINFVQKWNRLNHENNWAWENLSIGYLTDRHNNQQQERIIGIRHTEKVR